ncbi:leucine-rich repeat and coiled-coil domain-containing protein 1-like isoform X2 [Mytilus trossulus]
MTSSQLVESELLCPRPQQEDGTALSQRDIDLSQRSDSVILIEEGTIKKELDVEDLSQDCSLLTDRLPDVISQQQMNHVDCLRMRNSLTEILEEVKLRRNNDLENEERIRHLVQEKYEMERKLDGEKCHFASLSEEHDKKVAEIKRQFEDKIKVLQAEVKQNQVFKDCGQKETKSLKDDIRSLQITNYNLEKNLREQGRKLQLQTSSTNQHLKQLSSAEEKFQTISNYCKKISESQERLSRNVKEAVKLNRDLMYTNEHQKCIIEQHKREITLLNSQILDTKVKVESKPLDCSRIEQEQELSNLKQQLENERKDHTETEQELNKSTTNYKETLLKLQDSHKLIERHLQNAEAHQRENKSLSIELETCKEKLKKLEIALDSLHKELDIQKTVHSESIEKWQKEEEDLKSRITKLTEELETEKSDKAELEQLNTTWSVQNFRLSEELNAAKAILEVPKENGEYQTDLCMLNMKDSQCQIQPELSNFGNQTEQPRHYHITSQTDPPPCSEFSSQTYAPALAVSATQTREPSLINRSAQTEAEAEDEDLCLEIKKEFILTKSLPELQINKEREITLVRKSDSVDQRDICPVVTKTMTPLNGMEKYLSSDNAKDEKVCEESNNSSSTIPETQESGEKVSAKSANHCSIIPKPQHSDTSYSHNTPLKKKSFIPVRIETQQSTALYSLNTPLKNKSLSPNRTETQQSNALYRNDTPLKHQSLSPNRTETGCKSYFQTEYLVSSKKDKPVEMPHESEFGEKGDNQGIKSMYRAFSVNKEFLKLYETEKDNVIQPGKSLGKEEERKNYKETSTEGHVSNNVREKEVRTISGSTNVSKDESDEDDFVVEKRKEKTMKDQNILYGYSTENKNRECSVINSIGEKSNKDQTTVMEENRSLRETPKKMSLYESHVDGYLSKINSGNLQNTVGVKMVKPRDNQDVPKSLKFVEYLQPTEKVCTNIGRFRVETESPKVKSSSPSSKGFLSLVKRRSNFYKENLGLNMNNSAKNPLDFQESDENPVKKSSSADNQVSSLTGPIAGCSLGPSARDNQKDVNKAGCSDTNMTEVSKLSPYSRYKALLKPKMEKISSLKQKPEGNKVSSAKKRGILKESPSKEKKNVTFSENMVQVKHLTPEFNMSGDQCLYSDDDEDTIELISSQEDCSEEKRPRLS